MHPIKAVGVLSVAKNPRASAAGSTNNLNE
jgi:hypothetical protein